MRTASLKRFRRIQLPVPLVVCRSLVVLCILIRELCLNALLANRGHLKDSPKAQPTTSIKNIPHHVRRDSQCSRDEKIYGNPINILSIKRGAITPSPSYIFDRSLSVTGLTRRPSNRQPVPGLHNIDRQIPFMTPYTPNSTAATYGSDSPPSPTMSSPPSPRSHEDEGDTGHDSKRRRVESYTIHADQQHDREIESLVNASPTRNFHTSQSYPSLSSTLGNVFGGQGTFLDSSRDFLNIALSSHTVQAALPRIIQVVQELPLPGLQHIIDYLPVASADSSHFMGWRGKSDTWPLGGCRYLNRSFTR